MRLDQYDVEFLHLFRVAKKEMKGLVKQQLFEAWD